MAVPTVVGRADEQEVVGAAVRRASAGGSAAVLVSGDAGAGKTTLVRAAADQSAPDVLVLSGACLPMTSVVVPLLGLRSAVRSLDPGRRPNVLTDMPDSAAGDTDRGGVGHPAPLSIDAWLSDLCARQPVVLCIDDLHWADPETLDSLMYVLAGPSDRALTVLVTYRASESLGDHLLRRWVADVRRLPGVTELVLGPLDHEATNDLMTTVLGGMPHVSLVDDVYGRSGGNPYLIELLVQGLEPGARALPPGLPDGIVPVVARGWFSLAAPTKRVVSVIAAGGHPVDARALDQMASIVDVAAPGDAITEAIAAGLLEVDAQGCIWFHHPLQAEALETVILPAERRSLHAALAAALTTTVPARTEGGGALAARVSDHFILAQDTASAYRWSLDAAGRLHGTDAHRERLRMLRRAASLHASVPEAAESLEGLLAATMECAGLVADWETQIQAIDGLLGLVEETKEPLRVAVLLSDRAACSFNTGRGEASADLEHAVELTTGYPGAWQRLVVLAEFAGALVWEDEVERATEIVRISMGELQAATARKANSGSGCVEWERATARVLANAASVALLAGDADRARELGREAADTAFDAGLVPELFGSTFWEAEAEPGPNRSSLRTFSRRRAQLEELGAAHAYLGWLCAVEASGWFVIGEWSRCAELLRVALGADPGPAGDVIARLAAAQLGARQGRLPEAQAHLARAEEIVTDIRHTPAFHFDLVRAEVLLAAGDLQGAVDAALAGVDPSRGVPNYCEWLLPMAARGLADRCQQARDSGSSPEEILVRVDAMIARHPAVVRDLVPLTHRYRARLAGFDALYVAEVARAHASPSAAAVWGAAADALDEAELPWEEGYAAWRAAEAVLSGAPDPAERRGAAAMLRRGHSIARRLGAVPSLTSIEALGRTARISLTAVEASRTGSTSGGEGLDGLTRREREILAHVVAGRTYTEIATALFVSEKTVSSHISNVLRKTGTANRIELAAWAMRMAGSG